MMCQFCPCESLFVVISDYLFSAQSRAAVDACCFVFVSFNPGLNNIEANNKSVRYTLGQRVRNQLRIIPELRFFIDDSLDYIDRIDELLGGRKSS